MAERSRDKDSWAAGLHWGWERLEWGMGGEEEWEERGERRGGMGMDIQNFV